MKAQMRGFLLRAERDKANLVGLAHLFKRPANARIARQALAAVGRPLKGRDDDGHREMSLRLDRNRQATALCIGRSPRLAVAIMCTRPDPLGKLIAGT